MRVSLRGEESRRKPWPPTPYPLCTLFHRVVGCSPYPYTILSKKHATPVIRKLRNCITTGGWYLTFSALIIVRFHITTTSHVQLFTTSPFAPWKIHSPSPEVSTTFPERPLLSFAPGKSPGQTLNNRLWTKNSAGSNCFRKPSFASTRRNSLPPSSKLMTMQRKTCVRQLRNWTSYPDQTATAIR